MSFDFSQAQDSGFGVIPAGTYNVELTSAEDTTSKSLNKMFKMEFTIVDEEYKGRKLFTQFVYGGPTASEKVVQITASKIKDMCKNMGIEPKFKEPQDLVGKRCAAVVKIRTDEVYGDKNEISYFKPTQKNPPKINKSESIPF